MIVGFPAQDKTGLEAPQRPQPRAAAIAAIKDMQEGLAPTLRDQA